MNDAFAQTGAVSRRRRYRRLELAYWLISEFRQSFLVALLFGSALVVALRCGGIGVPKVDSPNPGQFDQADADFLAGFAGLLGIAP